MPPGREVTMYDGANNGVEDASGSETSYQTAAESVSCRRQSTDATSLATLGDFQRLSTTSPPPTTTTTVNKHRRARLAASGLVPRGGSPEYGEPRELASFLRSVTPPPTNRMARREMNTPPPPRRAANNNNNDKAKSTGTPPGGPSRHASLTGRQEASVRATSAGSSRTAMDVAEARLSIGGYTHLAIATWPQEPMDTTKTDGPGFLHHHHNMASQRPSTAQESLSRPSTCSATTDSGREEDTKMDMPTTPNTPASMSGAHLLHMLDGSMPKSIMFDASQHVVETPPERTRTPLADESMFDIFTIGDEALLPSTTDYRYTPRPTRRDSRHSFGSFESEAPAIPPRRRRVVPNTSTKPTDEAPAIVDESRDNLVKEGLTASERRLSGAMTETRLPLRESRSYVDYSAKPLSMHKSKSCSFHLVQDEQQKEADVMDQEPTASALESLRQDDDSVVSRATPRQATSPALPFLESAIIGLPFGSEPCVGEPHMTKDDDDYAPSPVISRDRSLRHYQSMPMANQYGADNMTQPISRPRSSMQTQRQTSSRQSHTTQQQRPISVTDAAILDTLRAVSRASKRASMCSLQELLRNDDEAAGDGHLAAELPAVLLEINQTVERLNDLSRRLEDASRRNSQSVEPSPYSASHGYMDRRAQQTDSSAFLSARSRFPLVPYTGEVDNYYAGAGAGAAGTQKQVIVNASPSSLFPDASMFRKRGRLFKPKKSITEDYPDDNNSNNHNSDEYKSDRHIQKYREGKKWSLRGLFSRSRWSSSSNSSSKVSSAAPTSHRREAATCAFSPTVRIAAFQDPYARGNTRGHESRWYEREQLRELEEADERW